MNAAVASLIKSLEFQRKRLKSAVSEATDLRVRARVEDGAAATARKAIVELESAIIDLEGVVPPEPPEPPPISLDQFPRNGRVGPV